MTDALPTYYCGHRCGCEPRAELNLVDFVATAGAKKGEEAKIVNLKGASFRTAHERSSNRHTDCDPDCPKYDTLKCNQAAQPAASASASASAGAAPKSETPAGPADVKEGEPSDPESARAPLIEVISKIIKAKLDCAVADCVNEITELVEQELQIQHSQRLKLMDLVEENLRKERKQKLNSIFTVKEGHRAQ